MSRRRVRNWAVVCLTLGLAGCATLGPPPPLQPGYAAPPAGEGALQRHGEQITQALAGDGESAFWLLDRNELALTARLALTDEAVSTLDIQYFIWQPDATGRLLMRRVLQAADRGVRVRILLDDFALLGQDAEIAGLDGHPLIDVRVFNPWRRRATMLRAVEFLLRSRTLNHRMHNKVYTADNHFSIIGGRNIGDRYFGLAESFVLNDLDVLAAGPAATAVSASFDEYWNSSLVYPGMSFARGDDPATLLGDLRRRLDAEIVAHADLLEMIGIEPKSWDEYLGELSRSFAQAPAELHYDSPMIRDARPDRLYAELLAFVGSAEQEVLISTPYFIPERELVEMLGALTAGGVRVVVLTNSLASNNQSIAHTGYRRWRRTLLGMGVELYEFRRDAQARAGYSTPPNDPRAMGLHSKAVVVDRHSAFVGSPNVDPRSLLLNTEIAFIVHSAPFARQVADLIVRDMQPENAWQVMLTDDNWLLWSNDERTVARQPARGFAQRTLEFFLNLLPVKGQL